MLVNPENAVITMETEDVHIMEWARMNKMTVNMVTTKEIIFHRSNPKIIIFPNGINNIQHVTTFKLFGVLSKPDSNFNDDASSCHCL
jgi:hypothetical protein